MQNNVNTFGEERLSTRRILITTISFSLIITLPIWAMFGTSVALGYIVGSAWMCINFLILSLLLSYLTGRRLKSKVLVILLVFAKMLLLYSVLVLLFWVGWFNHLGLVAGISTLWMVILFKTIGLSISPSKRDGNAS